MRVLENVSYEKMEISGLDNYLCRLEVDELSADIRLVGEERVPVPDVRARARDVVCHGHHLAERKHSAVEGERVDVTLQLGSTG